MVVLDAKLNSPLNGDTFKCGHRAKKGALRRYTGNFAAPSQYISLVSVCEPVLTFQLIVQDAEFNAVSNGGAFKGEIIEQKEGLDRNFGVLIRFC